MTDPDRDPRETLARIRAQANAATEGPWRHISIFEVGGFVEDSRGRELFDWAQDDAGTICTPDADAEFIAASRTTVPWLLEQVELRDEALNAVLKLHKPVQASTTSNGGVIDITVCDHCLDPAWPCPTVTAITTELEKYHD